MIITEIHGTKFAIDGKDTFSPAEEMSLEDMLHGMHVIDAAQKRFRSEETVKTHRKHLRQKTHQSSSTGVIIFCLAEGYIRMLAFFLCALAAMPEARTTIRVPTGRPKVAQVVRIGRHEISGVIAA